MVYKNIKKGKFISRPNRFIAEVEIDGKCEVCHVKNTGRLKELLISGAKVIVEKSDKPERKTKYDLIAVYKGDMLVNIDSLAPNKVFGEWAEKSGYFGKIKLIKPECRYKNSRFDFYIETESRKIFIEAKGVTLENDGVVSFPDAPTERGIKHLAELSECVKEGFDAYVFFIVKLKNAKYFTPNRKNHPEFADALELASKNGVNVKCLRCNVEENSLIIEKFIDVCI